MTKRVSVKAHTRSAPKTKGRKTKPGKRKGGASLEWMMHGMSDPKRNRPKKRGKK